MSGPAGSKWDIARALPWAAAMLALIWCYQWLVSGQHGIAVHLVLVLAFVLVAIWGLFRAR